MTRTGKIARLPHQIREQLNHRLQDGQKANPILPWLNSLPEVRSMLKTEFAGRPINAVNLTEWRQGGYRDFQARQSALELIRSLDDQHAFGHESLAVPLTARLAHWVALQFAAVAQSVIAAEDDTEAKWARLRQLCADISRLRRGDLYAERITIDRGWLALETANTDAEREREFWKWTERPDVREKLYPDQANGLTPETLEKIERELNLM